MNLIGFYQRSCLQNITRKTSILKMFPNNLQSMEKTLPNIPKKSKMKHRPAHLKPIGKKKKRVAFFSGCLMDTMFLKTNNATMKLLQLLGCEIINPTNQGCSGAIQGHSAEDRKSTR